MNIDELKHILIWTYHNYLLLLTIIGLMGVCSVFFLLYVLNSNHIEKSVKVSTTLFFGTLYAFIIALMGVGIFCILYVIYLFQETNLFSVLISQAVKSYLSII